MWECFDVLYLIGPDELVNMGYANFCKMVWMTMVHVFMGRPLTIWGAEENPEMIFFPHDSLSKFFFREKGL